MPRATPAPARRPRRRGVDDGDAADDGRGESVAPIVDTLGERPAERRDEHLPRPVEELVAQSVSAAEERFTQVEVSLVLDISSSMGNFNRIDNLRTAGQDFIDTLFEGAEPGQVSVSLIPYAGQVNAGPAVSALYNVSPRILRSQCVDFAPAAYGNMALSTTDPLVGSGHFDPWHIDESPILGKTRM